MVKNTVEHEPEMGLHPVDVVPPTQVGVHLAEIHDGEAPIRGIGKKGKDMDSIKYTPEVGFAYI